jgi:hypothetical protein
MYKSLGLMILLLLALLTTGCGSSSNSNSGNINGTWTASLTNPDNSPAFAFTTNFTEASGGSISITNFTFTSNGSCFPGTTTETGTFGLSGNSNGNVTGTFGMNISSTGTTNQLALQGTVNGNAITGKWTLTGGTGCSGNGTFTNGGFSLTKM